MPTYKIRAYSVFEFEKEFEVSGRSFSAAEDSLRAKIESLELDQYEDWKVINYDLELQVEDKRDVASPH